MINTIFIIASVVTVIGAVIAINNFITKKLKMRCERGKSKRAAKNILDYLKEDNFK